VARSARGYQPRWRSQVDRVQARHVCSFTLAELAKECGFSARYLQEIRRVAVIMKGMQPSGSSFRAVADALKDNGWDRGKALELLRKEPTARSARSMTAKARSTRSKSTRSKTAQGSFNEAGIEPPPQDDQSPVARRSRSLTAIQQEADRAVECLRELVTDDDGGDGED
jgi:hypothetical protein